MANLLYFFEIFEVVYLFDLEQPIPSSTHIESRSQYRLHSSHKIQKTAKTFWLGDKEIAHFENRDFSFIFPKKNWEYNRKIFHFCHGVDSRVSLTELGHEALSEWDNKSTICRHNEIKVVICVFLLRVSERLCVRSTWQTLLIDRQCLLELATSCRVRTQRLKDQLILIKKPKTERVSCFL